MSFLAPLYFAGMLAVSLPVIFHLIRRTPRGRRRFSSLMFLAPSPPRVTRRSRLDHLLLLCLRGLALTLLAIAFARPFLREAASLIRDDVGGRRIALLVDTSASMRRGDVWPKAKQEVDKVLAQLDSGDDVALYTFDAQVTPRIEFDQPSSPRHQEKASLVQRRLAALEPTWAHTDTGLALVTVADQLDLIEDTLRADSFLQIVLVTDLQQGSQIEALRAYEWPSDVKVAIRHVSPRKPDNASLRVLLDDPSEPNDRLRIRVSNAANSACEQFDLYWATPAELRSREPTTTVYVPPGQSRVVRVEPPKTAPADRLLLTGDHGEFDNVHYVVPLRRRELSVHYVGSDKPDDPNGLRYYLERALAGDGRTSIRFQGSRGDEPLSWSDDASPKMVVVSEAVSPSVVNRLKDYLQQGGTVVLVPKDDEAALTLVGFDETIEVDRDPSTPRGGDYAMLAEIDFTHPLFAAFASPQYSDFTKIHFWRHRRVDLKEDESTARVVARFDNGDPALWEQAFGTGRLYALTSSWHPDDSELALSSKFVPLMAGFLEEAEGGRQEYARFTVGDRVTLPDRFKGSSRVTVTKPDGSVTELAPEDESFGDTNLPGLYRLEANGTEWEFAVNIAKTESDTSPLDVERLEQNGVVVGDQPTWSDRQQRERQLRDLELEGRQRLWQWLLAGALCVLTLETWLAGRFSRATKEIGGDIT